MILEFDKLFERDNDLEDANPNKYRYIERVINTVQTFAFRGGGEGISGLSDTEKSMLLYQEYLILREIGSCHKLYGPHSSTEQERIGIMRLAFHSQRLEDYIESINRGERVRGLQRILKQNVEIYLKMRELGWVKGVLPSENTI